MNQDIIFIEELCVPASIGVFDWEKQTKQDLLFDVEIEYCFAQAAETDNITDTVCYAGVAKRIEDVVTRQHYDLLEHLVEVVAQELLSAFEIHKVGIRLSKPGAVPDAKTVGVKIVRVKGQ